MLAFVCFVCAADLWIRFGWLLLHVALLLEFLFVVRVVLV